MHLSIIKLLLVCSRIRDGKLEKYNGSSTDIVIPETVKEIGREAFKGCGSMASVLIPNSVTTIGNHAFEGCSKLTTVTIPEGVTSIKWGTFEGCSSLTAITIPNSVTTIGIRAFVGCSSRTLRSKKRNLSVCIKLHRRKRKKEAPVHFHWIV